MSGIELNSGEIRNAVNLKALTFLLRRLKVRPGLRVPVGDAMKMSHTVYRMT